MKKAGYFRGAKVAALLTLVLVSLVAVPTVYGQGPTLTAAQTVQVQGGVWHYLGAAIGLGMIVLGAALGIGKFAAAAAEGIARQPAAAAQISGAVNLPLFLLEGVAIIAEVVVLLIVLLK
jgi:F-type H+-transporting ATPase subunit c